MKTLYRLLLKSGLTSALFVGAFAGMFGCSADSSQQAADARDEAAKARADVVDANARVKAAEAQVKAAKVAGVQHFIYFSGAGVNRGIDKPWFRAKEYAEISILKSGIPATILRPSWIYGHGDRSMSQFIKMLRWLPLFPMLGDGKNHVQPVHVEDVAELVTMILEKKTTGVFDIGGPKEMTMNELVQTLCRTLDKHRPIIHIPKWLAKLGVFPLQIFPQPPMTPDAIDFITMDIQIDTSPIKQAYPNWKPRAFTDKNATKSIFCR